MIVGGGSEALCGVKHSGSRAKPWHGTRKNREGLSTNPPAGPTGRQWQDAETERKFLYMYRGREGDLNRGFVYNWDFCPGIAIQRTEAQRTVIEAHMDAALESFLILLGARLRSQWVLCIVVLGLVVRPVNWNTTLPIYSRIVMRRTGITISPTTST